MLVDMGQYVSCRARVKCNPGNGDVSREMGCNWRNGGVTRKMGV